VFGDGDSVLHPLLECRAEELPGDARLVVVEIRPALVHVLERVQEIGSSRDEAGVALLLADIRAAFGDGDGLAAGQCAIVNNQIQWFEEPRTGSVYRHGKEGNRTKPDTDPG